MMSPPKVCQSDPGEGQAVRIAVATRAVAAAAEEPLGPAGSEGGG